MINSVFILANNGDVLFSKQYRGTTDRAVTDYFWAQLVRETAKELPPIVVTPKSFIFHAKHKSKTGYLYFLATCDEETPPISISDLLYSVIRLFCHYFGQSFEETNLKENFTKVYQLLDAIIDDGKPFSTEAAFIVNLVPVPSVSEKFGSTSSSSDDKKKGIGGKSFTGVGSAIKTSGPLSISSETLNQSKQSYSANSSTSYSLTNSSAITTPTSKAETDISVPWRASNISHLKNGIYFDFIENMDVIIDPNGIPVVSEVVGYVQTKCEMTGMPEVNISFVNPGLLTDVCLARCVRRSHWEHGKTLDFIPPEGTFNLLTYRVKSGVTPPLNAKSSFIVTETGGKINVVVSMKQLMQGELYFPENLTIDIPLPKTTTGVNFVASVGSFTFDQITKTCFWEIGQMPKEGNPNIEGTFTRSIEEKIEPVVSAGAKKPVSTASKEKLFHPTLVAHFTIPGYSASGARVDQVNVRNVSYNPFKGVKKYTHAGSYQIRN